MSNEDARHPALQILEDLIRIQSVNPHFGEGAQGEEGVAAYLEQRLKKAGLSVTRQPVLAGRDNIIAELRIGKPELTLLFEAHMDTVSLGSMEDPLNPIYRDGRLYGRGACDTKSSLAGMVYAMEYWSRNREQLQADLVLCAAVDEEANYRGVLKFLEWQAPIAGAVVGEPTELSIVTATKGCSRMAVWTKGKAAHSAVPEEGDNAIYTMMDVLRFIREEAEPQLERISHPKCGQATVVVGTINGGTQINIVPESCVIQVDRRIIPGETPDGVREKFTTNLLEYLGDKAEKVEVSELLSDWALNTSEQSSIVWKAQEAMRSIGLDDETIGVPYGTDASKLQQLAGVPTIVFGPGSIRQAHAKEEWVSVEQVELAAQFYKSLAGRFGHLQQ